MLAEAKKIVLKIGGSLLFKNNRPDLEFIEKLAEKVAELKKEGKRVVIVSSGAIAFGKKEVGSSFSSETIPPKQALASIGQIKLMTLYSEFFKKYSLLVGQVLLSASDFSNRLTYINARNTILTLFDMGAVPVVNENDTVAVEEIKFGDNDTLSALVACLIDADILIILSDVRGLYTSDPKKNAGAKFLPVIEKIDKKIEEMAMETSVEGRVGGMQTKIKAAKIATRSGIFVVIGGGENFLEEFFSGKEAGTIFLPTPHRLESRKRWIAYGRRTKGNIFVDRGAKKAILEKGSSLLPVGVRKVTGKFQQGDSVSLLDEEGQEFARGIVYYSSEELEKIKGLKTCEIQKKLGYKHYDEVIHRDNLVIL
ncbi:glutamate 5-kinase [Candidatus Aerophobetes bacterium]|nr:glutamate 5-kinase [Candidatus Aerophobetes bacterium]